MGKLRFLMPKTAIPGVTAVVADSDRSFPRHMHDQFGIGLIERGAQKSLSGRGMVEAEAGNVITVNPGEIHDGVPLGYGGRAWTMLYFDSDVVYAAVSDIRERDCENFEFAYPVEPRPLADRFRALFGAATATGGMCWEETLLILLGETLETPETPRPHALPNTLRRVQQMIDDRPEKPCRLADLAREAGMSRFRFLRSFSHATGLTPHSYLLQRRVQLARRLLAGGMPPAEVAFTSGFFDQSHLNRVFVRHFGVTPAVYRAAID